MTDGTYRVELAYAPDSPDDARPWRARIYVDDNGLVTSVWGRDRDTALLHARNWVKTLVEHGDPETVLLDRNGDLINDPPEHTRFDSDTIGGHSVRVP